MAKSPPTTARLIVEAIERRNENAAISRFQLSLKAIGEIADRSVIDAHFLNALSSALLLRGWCMFQVSNTSYSLIRQKSAALFRKISSEQILSHSGSKE
ncbi:MULTISPECIES: hypothetical protein [Aeromonas]|uniref:hypothetical protein n=1 Tax=Aeromonas TaxID=642 RepID=UPI0039859743